MPYYRQCDHRRTVFVKLFGRQKEYGTIIVFKTTFIRCSSGGFKFGQKYVRTRNVPTPKFTHTLLHLQTAKKSLILANYRSLHVRKIKQSVGNLA